MPATEGQSESTKVIRATANTAAVVRDSMTVIAERALKMPQELVAVVDWIFTRTGRVVHLPPSSMTNPTALCGSSAAFLALMLVSLSDGAVAMGLPRAEAQLMVPRTMRGTTDMILVGEHPALIRDKVSTLGGCTIRGRLVLEEGCIWGTVARGVREVVLLTSQLGKAGVGGVVGGDGGGAHFGSKR